MVEKQASSEIAEREPDWFDIVAFSAGWSGIITLPISILFNLHSAAFFITLGGFFAAILTFGIRGKE
jgi:hypothetical protein